MRTHATDEEVVKESEPTKEKSLTQKETEDAVQKQASAFCRPDTDSRHQKASKTSPKILSKNRFSDL